MEYTIIRSKRRTVALQILPDGRLLVRCPLTMGQADILTFVQSKEKWIAKRLPEASAEPGRPFTQEEIQTLVARAKQEIPVRVALYAKMLGVDYKRIAIRKQRTRWGSCSSKGNLNFNCLLMVAPAQVLDYVVVHELSHRKHMNHSPAFWQTVKQVFPDYMVARKWLKNNGNRLISRL